MTDVFISYASEDRIRAKKLAEALEAKGFSVWWDRNIIAGQTYDEVIERELETATSVVVLWSKHSVISEWVKSEAQVAVERKRLFQRLSMPSSRPSNSGVSKPSILLTGMAISGIWDSIPSTEVFQRMSREITNTAAQ